MAESHSDDLRNVREDDRVTLETTEGKVIPADCVDRTTEHSAPGSVHITQTEIWSFETDGMDGVAKIHASITDGLAGTSDSPFPEHSALWNSTAEVNLGYVESVEIHGKE